MKNENALVQLKERARFYISTPERAAEALLFVRELENFAKDIKENVKERATKIMDEKGMELITYTITDESTGEIREWEVRRDYGSQTKEYKPEIVFDVLGEAAVKFFKVSKTNLDKFLKKESAKGNLSMDKVDEITKQENCVISMRKGSGVRITEKKAK